MAKATKWPKPGFGQNVRESYYEMCMSLRPVEFAPEEHYHICVRGNNKQDIFRNDTDRARLLFLIMHLQSPELVPKVGRIFGEYRKTGGWDVGVDLLEKIIASRYVVLEAFSFMTNHVHLALCEKEEQGTTRYMQRVLTAYAKYFNTKYGTVGHVFQGPFQSVHVEDNDQLLYLSTYIHRNPRELPGIAGKEHEYEWSSYRDYLGKNRFGGLLDPSLVIEQFENPSEYREFVDSSIAKDEAYRFDAF